MNVKLWQLIERRILLAVVRECLRLGYALNVDNGGDDFELPSPTTERKAIMAACMAADEDRLYVYRPRVEGDKPMLEKRWNSSGSTEQWTFLGWVLFVYGNDGFNVVSDYTTNLEAVLKPANALAEKYGA